jgi:hypothetical protein
MRRAVAGLPQMLTLRELAWTRWNSGWLFRPLIRRTTLGEIDKVAAVKLDAISIESTARVRSFSGRF